MCVCKQCVGATAGVSWVLPTPLWVLDWGQPQGPNITPQATYLSVNLLSGRGVGGRRGAWGHKARLLPSLPLQKTVISIIQ